MLSKKAWEAEILRVAARINNLLQRRWLRLSLIVSGSLIIVLASGLLLDYGYYYSRIYPTVMLETIDVGKMSVEETRHFLDENLWSTENLRLNLADSESIVLSLSELGVNWDKTETIKRIYQAGRGWSGYKVRLNSLIYKKPILVSGVLIVDEHQLAQAMTRLSGQVYRSPRDAFFEVEGESVRIVPEENGNFLKVSTLRQMILNALYDSSSLLQAPVGEWPAARTSADLDSYGVLQVMTSFYTDVAGGNPDRAYNIQLGSSSINSILMAPGEIFSFSDCVGRITREKGYRYAPIIVGDELVPGLGGGLCQVSTTLYNAALFANFEIVERHNHSMSISYIPLGRDATVAIGSLDLKFRNNRDHFIIIGADLTNLRLTFRIFGPPMEEKVEIVSSGYRQIAPPVRYEYTDDLPAGETELVKSGKSGYNITTWRVVYVDNQEISREMLARDYYTPTPAVYRVGTDG